MKKSLSIFFVLSFVFFSHLCLSENQPDYIQLVKEMNKPFISKIQNEHKLFLTGFGGKLMENVKGLSFTFTHYGILSKDVLRKLLIELSIQYLDRINNNLELRPFLDNYPFLSENLSLNIYVMSKDADEVFYPNYCAGELFKGNLYFVADDEMNPLGASKLEEKESYEQAREIVFQQYEDKKLNNKKNELLQNSN
ncbi:hypothetical protein [Criblamydia sequanensis]|uniref:Secreted protein n=1 Tax=Candidatus Criblamydia sequanensis CRIB-18 TaxID=1437425 RepID=A0A090D294_9BACT|nr:hypothetical protein [Criblamydia sequanensis]CDR34450.1 putative secreted protein [Criblamydia sequanensis CRIB-18]